MLLWSDARVPRYVAVTDVVMVLMVSRCMELVACVLQLLDMAHELLQMHVQLHECMRGSHVCLELCASCSECASWTGYCMSVALSVCHTAVMESHENARNARHAHQHELFSTFAPSHALSHISTLPHFCAHN